VPEAAMHEDRPPVAFENEVGLSRQRLGMQAIAPPKAMSKAAHDHFGLGVDRADGAHGSTAFGVRRDFQFRQRHLAIIVPLPHQ